MFTDTINRTDLEYLVWIFNVFLEGRSGKEALVLRSPPCVGNSPRVSMLMYFKKIQSDEGTIENKPRGSVRAWGGKLEHGHSTWFQAEMSP